MKRSAPTSLRAILRSAASALGLERAAHQALITEMWAEIVGAEAAAAARPAELRGSTLVVDVEPGLWVQELSARRGRFVEEINRRLGTRVVSEIRIRPRYALQEDPSVVAAESGLAKDVDLTEQELAMIDRTVAEIADAELREATRRTMASQFKWSRRVHRS